MRNLPYLFLFLFVSVMLSSCMNTRKLANKCNDLFPCERYQDTTLIFRTDTLTEEIALPPVKVPVEVDCPPSKIPIVVHDTIVVTPKPVVLERVVTDTVFLVRSPDNRKELSLELEIEQLRKDLIKAERKAGRGRTWFWAFLIAVSLLGVSAFFNIKGSFK